MKYIHYNAPNSIDNGWVVQATSYHPDIIPKCEVIQSLGNGYLGLRAADEEAHSQRHYGLFIGGTFNTPAGVEVPELPNGADCLYFHFWINGDLFTITPENLQQYSKTLNLKHGLLTRRLVWTSPQKIQVTFQFETYVSYANVHLIHQRITITPNQECNIRIDTGINGQTTNSGTQHFIDYDARYYQQSVLQYIFQTDQSKIRFFYNRAYQYRINGQKLKPEQVLQSVYGYDRRQVYLSSEMKCKAQATLTIESATTIHTERDFDFVSDDYETLLAKYAHENQEILLAGFDKNFTLHQKAYKQRFAPHWVKVTSSDEDEQTKINLATYHLIKMTPWYDHRLNIDAKGWVGEEYKGHTFWDTEIYIFPYYLLTNPQKAKELLMHRYFVMPSAFKKARVNNYLGAMWPWETSWKNDGETCPTWGEVDYKTGQRIKVWAAYNELHIGADIMWAIMMYFYQTNDVKFMRRYGLEMLLQTALFWVSKLEKTPQGYAIKNVTGPNEYKEDVNNNAFTNYMVHYGIMATIHMWDRFVKPDPQLTSRFQSFATLVEQMRRIVTHIYLPLPNQQLIIPENDTYLTLPQLANIAKYKTHKGSIWLDYTSRELNYYQVNKQADLVCLFYTLPQLFSLDTIMANWNYYEARTLHGSSLSLSMHATTANLVSQTALGYEYFQKSLFEFDDNLNNCLNGIHAAAMGGILKCLLEGFGGVNCREEYRIQPHLPEQWQAMSFNFYIGLNYCHITISHNTITIQVTDYVEPATFCIHEQSYNITSTQLQFEVIYA